MTALVVLKATLILTLALGLAYAAKRWVAATRHALLVAAQSAVLALPLLSGAMPSVSVDVPAAIDDTPFDLAIPSFRRTANTAPSPLFTIWVAGFLLVAAVKSVAFVRAMGVVRRARPFDDVPVERRALSPPTYRDDRRAKSPPLHKHDSTLKEVRLSDEVAQPSSLGRHILLPANAVEWSPDRFRAVLLHERAHVTRHDTLLALIGDAACAVYWFHPLAWLAARRARIERERACDDVVLAAGVTADGYASAIVEIARNFCRRSAASMPMAAPSQLEVRIRAILDPTVRRGHTQGALLVAVLAFAVVPLLAAVSPFPRPRLGEPDLIDDAVALPHSELVEAVAPQRVRTTGPDGELITVMMQLARRTPRSTIDFVPDRARWALTRVQDGELVTSLLASLHDPDWRIRTYAAWGLGVSGDRRATRPLMRLLDEEIWRVRTMAAHALAAIADPAAEEAMLAKVDDPAWQVRTGVVKYLAAIGGHDDIIKAMRDDRHEAVRDEASR
jgi:beta-lactamase regulating signal transducer with metallopeptidase domain